MLRVFTPCPTTQPLAQRPLEQALGDIGLTSTTPLQVNKQLHWIYDRDVGVLLGKLKHAGIQWYSQPDRLASFDWKESYVGGNTFRISIDIRIDDTGRRVRLDETRGRQSCHRIPHAQPTEPTGKLRRQLVRI